MLLALAVYGFHRMMMVYLYYRNRADRPAAGTPLDPLPAVTVQLPVFNERYVVERLIRAVAALDYPRALLEIQVLDDSTDETAAIARRAVERERARGIDIHYIHREHRTGYKAGALQEGMERARGELLFIFDADFVPPPAFIRNTLDFFSDPEVGMVQARWDHLNRNFSLLTRLQAILLDGHFVVEHTARNRSGRFFNFNGTAGAWRRTTIEEAGGWKSDTLTEDIDLSYRAQLAHWKFVYLKDVVSPAEVPVDINGFKTQQHRWAKGAIQTARKLLPGIFRSAFPLHVKIESFFHLTNNLSYPLVIALSILVFPAMVIRHRLGWTRLILLDFPLFFISTFSVILFYVASQREIDPRWMRKLRYMPMVMSLGIGLAVNNAHAVLEALIGKGGEFRRTPKYSVGEEAQAWQGKAYRTRINLSFPCEVVLAAYFATTIGISFAEGIYLAIPFLMIFFSGYFYMAMLTVTQQFPRLLAPSLAAVRAPGTASSGVVPLPPSAEAQRQNRREIRLPTKPINAAAGIVRTRPRRSGPPLPLDGREARDEPTPTSAPVIVWVVDTGIPSAEAPNTVIAPAVSAQNPPIGWSFVIRWPIVRTILHPPESAPSAIAACAVRMTHTGITWVVVRFMKWSGEPVEAKSPWLDTSRPTMIPIVFCASLVPCARE